MKRLICYIILALIPVFSVQMLNAQSNDVSAALIRAFKTGNAASLAEHLNDNVELVIPQTNNFFTRQQAKNILTDFFRKYEAKDFTIEHRDIKANASFLIGTLTTAKEKFRVSLFIRKNVVYQLRIEELKS